MGLSWDFSVDHNDELIVIEVGEVARGWIVLDYMRRGQWMTAHFKALSHIQAPVAEPNAPIADFYFICLTTYNIL
jgi:hypothetical protein